MHGAEKFELFEVSRMKGGPQCFARDAVARGASVEGINHDEF